MKKIPSINIPIIDNGKISNNILSDVTKNKKVIIFGIPGAYTPTCSEKHLPSFLKNKENLLSKKVDDIYCLSVNDSFVMKSWLNSFPENNFIKGIADGNAEFTKQMDLLADYSKNFMGKRCKRFSLIAEDNVVISLNIDETGKFLVSSADYLLKQLT